MRSHIWLLVFKVAVGFAVNFSDFDRYQNLFTREELEERISLYLEKDSEIRSDYFFDEKTLFVGDYPLRLSPVSTPKCEEIRKRSSLIGVKIAIDPGHFGGPMAVMEERYIHVPAELTDTGEPIQFDEGTLTFQTAVLLKELLEAQGATVMMTRSAIGSGAIELSFEQWLQAHPELAAESQSKVFRAHYNHEDLLARAEKVNAFQPDLTLMIHYNVHLSESEKKNRTILTETNFNLVFVPGAFCAGELKKPESRYEFLRLLLTSDLDRSLILGKILLDQLAKHTRIGPIPRNEVTSYSERACLFQKEGLYCRNLALTRLIHGPLCYGETLFQNNKEEIYRLSEKGDVVTDYPCPDRVRQVAQAYFQAIREYLSSR